MLDGMTLEKLTRLQWNCLSDADQGRVIATTKDTLQTLMTAADGATYHHVRVVDKLVASGLLDPCGPERFKANRNTKSALALPCKG